MAIKRITISVPEALAKKIKKAAGDKPVSAWVTELVEERLDDAELEQLWKKLYAEAKPTAADERWAEAAFERTTKARKRGAA